MSTYKVDKALIYTFLAMGCIWLILDSAFGNDNLGKFLETLFPFMKESGDAEAAPADPGSAGPVETTPEGIRKPAEPTGMQAPTPDGKPIPKKVPDKYPGFVTPMGPPSAQGWIKPAKGGGK